MIIDASEAVKRIAALRATAATAAIATWWTQEPVIVFDWKNARKSNTTMWITIWWVSETGVKSPLTIRFNDAVQIGQLAPSTEAGLQEMLEAAGPKAGARGNTRAMAVLSKKPCVTTGKYKVQVKTAEDGITVLSPPSDQDRNDYYYLVEAVNEVFAAECGARVDRGLALVAAAAAGKKAGKTAADIIADFIKAQAVVAEPSYVILVSEQMLAIRKQFSAQKDIDVLTKFSLVVPSTKIVSLVQEFIANSAQQNAGCPLPNPLTRININFDADGRAVTMIFDKSKPFIGEDGKQKFEMATVDGRPVDATSIHKMIRPRARIDGIVSLDAICTSPMGISLPVKFKVLVVSPPPTSSQTIDLDDMNFDVVPSAGGRDSPLPVVPAVLTQPSPAVTNTAGASAGASAEDFDDILDGLSGL